MTLIDRLRTAWYRIQPTGLGIVGLVETTVAFALFGGPIGLAIGGALFVVGLFVPASVAFALGQASVLVVLPSPTLVQIVALEGALFLVLLGPATRDAPVRLGGLAGGLFVLLGSASWIGAARIGVLETGALLVVGVGLASYLVHRYERVVLGLAGGDVA